MFAAKNGSWRTLNNSSMFNALQSPCTILHLHAHCQSCYPANLKQDTTRISSSSCNSNVCVWGLARLPSPSFFSSNLRKSLLPSHVGVTCNRTSGVWTRQHSLFEPIVVDEVQLLLGSNLWSAGGGIRGRHAARLRSRRGHAGQWDDCSRGEERLGHWYRGGWGSYTTSIEAAVPRGCRVMRFL